jgi:xanthosine utilization system XapX-like protein
MNTEKIIREYKAIIMVTLVIGLALLAVGTIFTLLNLRLVPNNKAIVGLSFIPLGVALAYWIKLTMIRKSPLKMRDTIINENDERLISMKNEADAKSFKIIQGALFLAYMGYTLMVPEDIFESLGWWLLLVLLFISFISQAIMSRIISGKANKTDEE